MARRACGRPSETRRWAFLRRRSVGEAAEGLQPGAGGAAGRADLEDAPAEAPRVSESGYSGGSRSILGRLKGPQRPGRALQQPFLAFLRQIYVFDNDFLKNASGLAPIPAPRMPLLFRDLNDLRAFKGVVADEQRQGAFGALSLMPRGLPDLGWHIGWDAVPCPWPRLLIAGKGPEAPGFQVL